MKQNDNNLRKPNPDMPAEGEFEKRERCKQMIQPYLRESQEWLQVFNRKKRMAMAYVVMAVVIAPLAVMWLNTGVAPMHTEENILYADASVAMQGQQIELKTFCNVGCSNQMVLTAVTNTIGIA